MKPEITKEQAEAITYLRELSRNDAYILRNHGEYARHCAVLNNLSLVSLAAALINGYEIEKSPEEKVRELYNYNHEKHERSDALSPEDYYTAGIDWGIRQTLNHLGVKIEGVNA